MKHTFEFTDNRDKEDYKFYQIEADYTFFTDGNYGADADGNRGVSATFLDDFEFTVSDENGEDVTTEIEENDKELFEMIVKAVEEEGLSLDCDEDSYDGCDCEYDNLD